MKFKNIYKFIAPATLSVVVAACTPAIDTPIPMRGTADFSKYVAIGNSLTAGFADGGVYREGQLNSYPNIIAGQLRAVGLSNFRQPLYTEATSNGTGYLKLTAFNNGSPVIRPETSKLGIVGRGADGRTPLYEKFTGAIDNLGVPGIRISDIKTNGYGFNNPAGFNAHFQRLLPDAGPSATDPGGAISYLQYLQKYYATEKPTFFTCWLGNNDALGFATTGGVTPLTPTPAFGALYKELMGVITAGGAKGVVATIPNVTSIPYLNTVTYAAVRNNLAGARAGFKAAVARGLGVTTLPTNLEQLIDSNMDDIYIRYADGSVNKATSADLFILTATDSLGSTRTPIAAAGGLPFPKGFSRANPLDHPSVLDRNEVAAAVAAVTAYNNSIRAEAGALKIPVFEAGLLLDEFIKGKTYNGLTLTSAFITGGIFSLDGVHATPRGYAIMANAFISTINAGYGANINQVNLSTFQGVTIKP